MQLLETARNLAFAVSHLPEILKERNEILGVAVDLQQKNDLLEENLVELELALDEMGWRETGGIGGGKRWEFNRHALRRMMDLSRKMYLMNPLMRRSVNVQALYVWALGVTIKAANPLVQQVMDDFFNDPKNMSTLTSQPAWTEREKEQQITGNTFLAMFHNTDTGASRVRALPVDQIAQIICNPNDRKDVWFYKRAWLDEKGQEHILLYPDINNYNELTPVTYQGIPVEIDVCILHVKTGGLMDMAFGMPEHYSIFAWATAYKKMLENWATIIQAYARMAMKVTGLAGKKGIAAAKSKMGTGVASTRALDNNPPNNTAGWFAASGGVDVAAIRTAGATTSASEGKPLKDMVAAGADIPSHFYGDADQGNFATSTTLDRPTELKFVSRQKLWLFVIQSIVDRLILWSAQAPTGVLSRAGAVVAERENLFNADEVVYTVTMPGNDDLFVEISFPDILERNVTERVRAVVAAATLGGSKAEGIIPDRKFLCGEILQALGVNDWQEKLDDLYPEIVTQGFIDPPDELAVQQTKADGAANVGKAALQQAQTAKTVANKPQPKPQAAGSNGSRGSGSVSNRR